MTVVISRSTMYIIIWIQRADVFALPLPKKVEVEAGEGDEQCSF